MLSDVVRSPRRSAGDSNGNNNNGDSNGNNNSGDNNSGTDQMVCPAVVATSLPLERPCGGARGA